MRAQSRPAIIYPRVVFHHSMTCDRTASLDAGSSHLTLIDRSRVAYFRAPEVTSYCRFLELYLSTSQ